MKYTSLLFHTLILPCMTLLIFQNCSSAEFGSFSNLNDGSNSNLDLEEPPTTPTINKIFNNKTTMDINGNAYGDGHICSVTLNKQVACWGWNASGQLGVGDKINRHLPEYVLGGEQGGIYLTNISKIAVGRDNSCAITATGELYCWGLGLSNGMGSDTEALSPARVVTGDQAHPSGYLSDVIDISLGYNFACALTTLGNVFCWGQGKHGRLGTGLQTSFFSPKQVVGGSQGGYHLENIRSIDVGRATGCAVTKNGELYCWGDGRGTGSNSNSKHLEPVQTLAGEQSNTQIHLKNIKDVHVGWNRACALTTYGQVFCWGDARNHSIGNGVYEKIVTPIQVLGGEQGGPSLENIEKMSYGFAHACGITTNKTLFCWGYGNGALPTLLKDQSDKVISSIEQIIAGPTSTCYTDTNQDAFCWGSNRTGQLGNDNVPTNEASPIQVNTSLILKPSD